MSENCRKDRVRNWIENKFDRIHKITDKLPLGYLDGILHGTSRGLSNFLMDKHPQNTSEKSDITLFFSTINMGKWKEQYPVRFAKLQEICTCKSTLAEMLDMLEHGITISCPGYKTLLFKINHKTRVEWEQFLSNQKQLLEKSATQELLQSKEVILNDLELISNKLSLLQFNQTDLRHLLDKEIRPFVANFQTELVEVKQTLTKISDNVERIGDTTSSTLVKVNHIEDMVKTLSVQQKEIQDLLKQVLGTD